MKSKMIVVIVVSILMLAGGILELIYINKSFDKLEERIDDILADDKPNYQKVYETKQWLEKRHKGLELFIPHFELNELSVLYNEILGAVTAGDDEGAITLIFRLKEYSERLQDVYSFRFQNVV